MLSLATCLSLLLAPAADAKKETTPEQRAVAFLEREVPKWHADHKCYSCHNNGDAARALYAAKRRSLTVPDAALADTTRWLTQPQNWDKNGGDEAASDRGLARIQFAAALIEGIDAGQVKDEQALARAAALVAEGQEKDGYWKAEAGTVGSPVTYGSCLATHFARRTLLRADPKKYADAVARADRWLRGKKVASVLDAAAILLALEGSDDADARAQRERCLALIRKGQGEAGGWGPFATSAAEPFDTAVVLLALGQFREDAEVKPLLKKGRAFLAHEQQEDGSWTETTRPAGAVSYAQRLSTAGWATLALLATTP